MGKAASNLSSGHRNDTRPSIILIAGFGDNASMFDGLARTHLADDYRLVPLDLPGFGAPPLDTEATLRNLAQVVVDKAKETGSEIIVAHSVASIIATLAAQNPDSPLNTIISLEGNITAEDAYFSGTAADHDNPLSFRTGFLGRLDEMGRTEPIIRRYREEVSKADALALWQLGTDARRFSSEHVPGEILENAAKVTYIYSTQNCPDSTLRWLEKSQMARIVLDNATHWVSVDQPDLLADKIIEALN